MKLISVMQRLLAKSARFWLGMSAMMFISGSVNAQMNIEITGVGQSLFPVAVMRFVGENQLPLK